MAVDQPAGKLAEKLVHLRTIVRGYGSALVAFSGGADSALVLKIAHDELGEKMRGLLAVSPTLPKRERQLAVDFAASVGAHLEVIASHELERPGFADNQADRCYHCKAELLDLAQPYADQHALDEILLGTNLDDLGEHRPGLAAIRERQARQPLVAAGLSKADVRAISRMLGLSTWNKPQLACLSSRFAYGTAITQPELERIDAFEETILALGFTQVRVRYHAQLARIEVEPSELERAFALRDTIRERGHALGFTYVSLDLDGFRSGSANEALLSISRRSKKPV